MMSKLFYSTNIITSSFFLEEGVGATLFEAASEEILHLVVAAHLGDSQFVRLQRRNLKFWIHADVFNKHNNSPTNVNYSALNKNKQTAPMKVVIFNSFLEYICKKGQGVN